MGPCPLYAEQAYGDALLYMRRPEAARDAYNRILAQVTQGRGLGRYAVFFAYVELDDFTAAYATIDLRSNDEPIWRYYRDDPTPPTQRRARLRRDNGGPGALTATSSARPGTAWCACPTQHRPTAIHGSALYQVANARGWPRRAQTEAEIAASLAPRDIGSRIALVETAINAYRFLDAQRTAAEVLALDILHDPVGQHNRPRHRRTSSRPTGRAPLGLLVLAV